MSMDFETAHAQFIHSHLSRRTGERRGRLERGHMHGEKLFLKNGWWPIFGNLDYLHPEYEVLDWRGFPYYIDLAYIRPFVRIGWEIKGFGPHVRDSDREKYRSELRRETFLQGLGWRILSLSYDDVNERPDICKMLINMNLSPYLLSSSPPTKPLLAENEIIRLACHLSRPLRPIDVTRHFDISYRTAISWMERLCSKGWLYAHNEGNRTAQYNLNPDVLRFWAP